MHQNLPRRIWPGVWRGLQSGDLLRVLCGIPSNSQGFTLGQQEIRQFRHLSLTRREVYACLIAVCRNPERNNRMLRQQLRREGIQPLQLQSWFSALHLACTTSATAGWPPRPQPLTLQDLGARYCNTWFFSCAPPGCHFWHTRNRIAVVLRLRVDTMCFSNKVTARCSPKRISRPPFLEKCFNPDLEPFLGRARQSTLVVFLGIVNTSRPPLVRRRLNPRPKALPVLTAGGEGFWLCARVAGCSGTGVPPGDCAASSPAKSGSALPSGADRASLGALSSVRVPLELS